MYDIITDIWRNPGATYSPMPMWLWDGELDSETLVKQLDDFHRKGIDGVIIRPCVEMTGVEYLSEEYFALVREICEAAKKRFMLVMICDDMTSGASVKSKIVAEDERFACRKIYAQPVDAPIQANEELLYRMFLKFEDGKLIDARLGAADGYEGYNFILGYADSKTSDPFNQYATELFIKYSYEKYYEHLSEFFGNTVIGFYNSAPTIAECSENGAAWSYSMIEDFFEAGADMTQLAYLIFGTKEKKLSREAEYVYHSAMRKTLNTAYYAPLSEWCKNHGVALMGHPTDAKECDSMPYFHITGGNLKLGTPAQGEELTAHESMIPKLAADCARHNGISRSSCVCFETENEDELCAFTPDEMMRQINFLFARGCNMIIPCTFSYAGRKDVGPSSVLWKNYRKIAMYIKRMSWLGATGANNPQAAVLCSPEHIPTAPVKMLYEEGYSFNYLTLDDFMQKAHIHDGDIHLDRYEYDTVLIDGRLRLNAEIVRKLGHFITQGGEMYRGSSFGSFMKKHAKKTSYFDGETNGKLRFTHYNKSGCDFFLLVNEGLDEITGRLITDISCAAEDFDPFTGKTAEMPAEMVDGGFAYEITVPAHSVKVIGMNPNALPKLGKADEYKLLEIVSLADGRMKFDFMKLENCTAKLRFTAVRDVAEVKVNGEEVGTLMFMPYECDITKYLHDGENEVAVDVTGGSSDASFSGCTVRVFEKI